MLKHGILGLLNYGSMTGYEIKEVFQESLSHFWTAQTSQIYRELQTLKKHGWVTDELIPQEGKPDKKPFTITEEGKEELHRWLKDLDKPRETNSPLLMKTFFLGELPVEENIAFFQSVIGILSGIQQAEGSVGLYKERVSDAKKALYWQMTLEYGVMHYEMVSKWAKRCIEKMKEMES